MKTIWKYTLDPAKLEIKMPRGAKLLTASEQNNEICVWAEVDTYASEEWVIFEVYGTGHEIPPLTYERDYIGTAKLEGGSLILHVYKINTVIGGG
jgi:hypothetical protein